MPKCFAIKPHGSVRRSLTRQRRLTSQTTQHIVLSDLNALATHLLCGLDGRCYTLANSRAPCSFAVRVL
jgi:hypothetical protein